MASIVRFFIGLDYHSLKVAELGYSYNVLVLPFIVVKTPALDWRSALTYRRKSLNVNAGHYDRHGCPTRIIQDNPSGRRYPNPIAPSALPDLNWCALQSNLSTHPRSNLFASRNCSCCPTRIRTSTIRSRDWRTTFILSGNGAAKIGFFYGRFSQASTIYSFG